MNVGTIIENPMLKIKLGTKTLGNIEEVFIQNLSMKKTLTFQLLLVLQLVYCFFQVQIFQNLF